MPRVGEFYLRHSARFSVAVTTAVVTAIAFSVTLVFQLIIGPVGDRGFWIGLALAAALPLLITPPITGAIVRLVHQLRQANELADNLANVDDLTKFRTRRRFLVEATAEIERSSQCGDPLVLMMLDIDEFKQINDTYGHLTGDRVLSEVADACRRVLAPECVMARLGGDEMAILLPITTLESGVLSAEQVRHAVSELGVTSHLPGRSTPDQCQVAVSVSIGVAPLHPGGPLDELVMRADQALYSAKTDGRNRVRLSEPLARRDAAVRPVLPRPMIAPQSNPG